MLINAPKCDPLLQPALQQLSVPVRRRGMFSRSFGTRFGNLVHGPGQVVKPTMRVSGGQYRVECPANS